MTRNDILDANELAEILGVTRQAIHYKVKRKELPDIRVGNNYIFFKTDLIKWGVLDGYVDTDGHVYCLKKR